MIKKFLLSLLFLPCITYASSELVQIVAFDWDEKNKTLTAISFGSGTAIGSNLVLTNAHVIKPKNEVADFLLLCLAGIKSNRSVDCNIEAIPIAIHPKWDAAILKPLFQKLPFQKIKIPQFKMRVGDKIRVEGFPVKTENFQNFGSNKTVQNIKNWLKNGGNLKTGGDHLTITRGEIFDIKFLRKQDQEDADAARYFLTNAKVNFGSSGGAVFDTARNYIGMPTFRNGNFEGYILDFSQLEGWINSNKDIKPEINDEIIDYYNQKKKTVSKRKRKISSSKNKKIISPQTRKISSHKKESLEKRMRYWKRKNKNY